MTNKRLLTAAISKGCKVLHLDIETSPHELWGYGLFKQNFSVEQIKEPGKITSVAYMSETLKKCYALEWQYKDDYKRGCDRRLLETLIPVINESDILVGQNLDAFDLKWINWRANYHNIDPVRNDLLTMDTLKLSRKVFRPPSHKLDFRSGAYGYGGKIPQTMKQIIAVAQGDKKEQAERVRYNIKDVIDERKIFWRELDSYNITKKIIRYLEDYVATDIPFCIKCQEQRQSKYDVRSVIYRNKRGYTCNRCEYRWVNR